jgi:hypothetical protein
VHCFYLVNLSILDVIQFLLNTPQVNGLAFLALWLILSYLLRSPLTVVTTLLFLAFIKSPVTWDIANNLTYLLHDYNVLLTNPINKVHPGCLYLSVTFVTHNLFRFISVRVLSLHLHQSVYRMAYFFILGAAALLLGCWWAFQESSWGGWWVWELSECLLGFILVFYICSYHTRSTTAAAPLYVNLYCIQWLALYMYWLLVKVFFSTTLHSFFNSSAGTLTAFQLSSNMALPLVTIIIVGLGNLERGTLLARYPRYSITLLIYTQAVMCYFIIAEYSVPTYQYLVWLSAWWIVIVAPVIATQRTKKSHLVYFAALGYFSMLPLLEFSASYTQIPLTLLQSASSVAVCVDGLFVQALVLGTGISTPHTYFTNAGSFIFSLYPTMSAFYLSIPGAFCFFIILRCDFMIMFIWYLVLTFGFLQLL